MFMQNYEATPLSGRKNAPSGTTKMEISGQYADLHDTIQNDTT